jgi:alpha-mannosidase
MTTVHLIFNAHLDPIWLWPWTAGLDSALATCRSACDLLDRHPDLIFTRGEAWVYQQIETVDPALFARIAAHVKTGRWEIVGGWYIQPDCNFPGGDGLTHQIDIGKRYFLDRFGQFPDIAYNVDSFGHTATLPRILHAAGQRYYVMMRPQEHEHPLPARLFRWSTAPGEPAITTFRIAGAYCTPENVSEDHVRNAASELPPGLEHTMCFVGVGDHGGGPSERLLQWCQEHRDSFPDMRLEFSSPRRFFAAIAAQQSTLPQVHGELQMHAVGCYSVHRPVKLAVLRAEHLLRQAEVALAADPAAPDSERRQIEEGWKNACFHQFHDTLGGTCIPSAYPQVYAELGSAHAAAGQVMHHAFRRRLTALPDDPRQRIVLLNASDQPFDDYVEFEPWLEGNRWLPAWQIRDGRGANVPYQLLESEAACDGITRILFRRSLAPGALDPLAIDTQQPATKAPRAAAPVQYQRRPLKLTHDAGIELDFAAGTLASGPAGLTWPLPQPHLIQDDTDTWSHDTASYPPEPLAVARWGTPKLVDRGPLMASVFTTARFAASTLRAEWRLYAGLPCVHLFLTVDWRQQFRMLKLIWTAPHPIISHTDGIPAGSLTRDPDARERPVRDFTVLQLGGDSGSTSGGGGDSGGVVCPDVFALDVDRTRLRLTLLRSPLMAHHKPHPPKAARPVFSDQGIHHFRFAFFPGPAVTPQLLDQHALAWHRPPLAADLTRGMPGPRHRNEWK